MKRKIFAVLLIALVLLATAACGGEAPVPEDVGGALQSIGTGDTVFQFLVTGPDETITGWDVHTDETTVGAALLAVGLIAGDESDWGLMVTEVSGIVADWDENQAFWAFYADGEFAMAGVDETDIEPGVVYAFVYTQG